MTPCRGDRKTGTNVHNSGLAEVAADMSQRDENENQIDNPTCGRKINWADIVKNNIEKTINPQAVQERVTETRTFLDQNRYA